MIKGPIVEESIREMLRDPENKKERTMNEPMMQSLGNIHDSSLKASKLAIRRNIRFQSRTRLNGKLRLINSQEAFYFGRGQEWWSRWKKEQLWLQLGALAIQLSQYMLLFLFNKSTEVGGRAWALTKIIYCDENVSPSVHKLSRHSHLNPLCVARDLQLVCSLHQYLRLSLVWCCSTQRRRY